MRDQDKPDDGPETTSQAHHFETNKNRYLNAGLCYVCAAQAGWGHQLGFSRVHPPCDMCAPIVAKFPFPAVAPWRMTLDASHTRTRLAADAAKAPS